MPKRVLDFDAMWGSDKLASCSEWAQAEYAWLYGLADASGCFELTNLRVIWGRVAAIRLNLTIERLEQIFDEFQDKGLLFVWEHEGKRYGHWTGSDVPGRLPPPSWRMRLERLAPPVPKGQFAEYVSRFARGRASLPGGGFRVQPAEDPAENRIENSNLKCESLRDCSIRGDGSRLKSRSAKQEDLRALQDEVEEAQTQDWNLDLDVGKKKKVGREGDLYAAGHAAECGVAGKPLTEKEKSKNPQLSLNSNANSESNAESRSELHSKSNANAESESNSLLDSDSESEGTREYADDRKPEFIQTANGGAAGAAPARPSYSYRDKWLQTAGELLVGRGPWCGPVKVKPEALERIRAREAARNGSRSP